MSSRRIPKDATRRELTDAFVRNAVPPQGKSKAVYRDTVVKGLALQVTGSNNTERPSYARSFVFLWKGRGKVVSGSGKPYYPLKWMGLGSISEISLAQARDKAREYRTQVVTGVDPISYREANKPVVQHSLKVVCRMYYDAHKDEWSNERYRAQWWSQLQQHFFTPGKIGETTFGDMPIDQITTGDVYIALKPIWELAQKSANDMRGRFEQSWYFAKAMKWCRGDNPFAIKGNLESLLSDVKKREIAHHAALPYTQVPRFMSDLKARRDVIARAVEFCVRSAVRTDAVVNATWGEFDLAKAVWTVPAERVKAKKGSRQPFLFPLPKQCIKLLEGLPSYASRTDPDAYVFAEGGERIGASAMLRYLDQHFDFVDPRETGADGKPKPITMHGFRSTFSDWSHDTGLYPESIIEHALQHVISNRVKAAYRRGSAFDLRMQLMADWSAFCDGKLK